MTERKAPEGVLHVGRFADPMYYLTREIGWTPNAGQEGYPAVRVPSGFVTDLASIPRVFWSMLRPDGLYTYPAIVHDYLYWEQKTTRAMADDILKFAMADFQVDALTVETVYRGVRVGGGFAWDENARRRMAGEKRILKRLPTDPRIRWEDWRIDPSVFA